MESIRDRSLSSNDSVGMIGGGFASETTTDSTGDEGVDVGSSGSASLLELTPFSGFAFPELPTASDPLPDDEADTTPGTGGTCVTSGSRLLLEQSVS